jgi:alanine dehydrogenase
MVLNTPAPAIPPNTLKASPPTIRYFQICHSAVPRTSTLALTAATLPYLLSFARLGVRGALRADPGLLAGLNTWNGNVTCPGVARAYGKPRVPAEEAVG